MTPKIPIAGLLEASSCAAIVLPHTAELQNPNLPPTAAAGGSDL